MEKSRIIQAFTNFMFVYTYTPLYETDESRLNFFTEIFHRLKR